MISIPPTSPLIISADLLNTQKVKPLERTSEREMPIPDKLDSRNDRRRVKRERRGADGRRIKGYDMRSGRDRRKTDRDAPSIEIEV